MPREERGVGCCCQQVGKNFGERAAPSRRRLQQQTQRLASSATTCVGYYSVAILRRASAATTLPRLTRSTTRPQPTATRTASKAMAASSSPASSAPAAYVQQLNTAAALLKQAARVAVFTGAGMSADSGISTVGWRIGRPAPRCVRDSGRLAANAGFYMEQVHQLVSGAHRASGAARGPLGAGAVRGGALPRRGSGHNHHERGRTAPARGEPQVSIDYVFVCFVDGESWTFLTSTALLVGVCARIVRSLIIVNGRSLQSTIAMPLLVVDPSNLQRD